MSDNIHVAVRMRPLISREIEGRASVHWNSQSLTTIFQANSPAVAFHFDHVFQGHENNEVVYSEFCSPIVKSVIDGFNGTIFAYGQTSSGKTFTMMGDDDGKTLGVVHYTISDIFTFIQDLPEREFLLRVSYMEIYNEMVRDLLSDKNENLKLQEDQYGLIKVSGLSEHIVQEADQVLTLMRQAERKRKTGETLMNEKSSRSHSIFRMIIESGLKDESDAAVIVSQFNLVDLAGSERAKSTGAKGVRFKESININKSLLTLSQVISQLSEKVQNDQFINYRDSKLTRILQNSLGGNARTAIICTVTPACHEETLSTLKFAERAKNIKNKPEVNEVLTEQALLKQYANKIKKLTKELEATKVEKAQQNKSLQEQIQNLKKSYVFQIAPEIKSRPIRRETWGGCFDAARLRLDMLPPGKPLTSTDLEERLLKASIPSIKEESSVPSSLHNRSSSLNLPTLEEERDTDVDALGTDDPSTDLNAANTKIALEDGDGDSISKEYKESCEECVRIIDRYEKKMEETQLQVDANLQVTLNDLLELRIFALEFLKREIKKLLGDAEFFVNNASSPILDQIKIEITALKELLVRLEFYVKNQNEHEEYFNEVLRNNMLENGMLKEQLEQVELTLKEKDTEQLDMFNLLLDVDSSISELMRNVKESVGQTSYVDCEDIKYPTSGKNKAVRGMKLLQKKILSLGSLIKKNTSLVTDMSIKLQETEDKLKFKNLEDGKKFQQSPKLSKSVQTITDNRLLETSRKLEEAEFCVEKLKKETNSLMHKLEMAIDAKEILEDKLQDRNGIIEKMGKDFEIERCKWLDNTTECVKTVEEKCDQMMVEQENKFFDEIDKLKQEYREHILRKTEIYIEQKQWQCKIDELNKEHLANMDEARCKLSNEIKDRYSEISKLEEKISVHKEEIRNITQINVCMKDKYKRYSAQMQQKLKEKGNKCVQEKQTQTELLQSNHSETLKVTVHTQTSKNIPIHASGICANFEQCSHCMDLWKISDLQNSEQNEILKIAKEIELTKRLKHVICDLKKEMLLAKTNNTNLKKENESLKQELSSKLVLLRSCHCRLIPNLSSAVKDGNDHFNKMEAFAQKKTNFAYEDNQKETKSSNLRKEISTIDSADILKNEIVQRAIQEEAKSLQILSLSNGSGPDGILKCAYLNQKLKKKDKELEKKNNELKILKKKLANNAFYSKIAAKENRPTKAKKSFHPFHPFPQGAVPQLQPKKILKEVNKNDPTSNYDKNPSDQKSNIDDVAQSSSSITIPDLLKMKRNNENKGNDLKLERKQHIEKLTGEPPECQQQ